MDNDDSVEKIFFANLKHLIYEQSKVIAFLKSSSPQSFFRLTNLSTFSCLVVFILATTFNGNDPHHISRRHRCRRRRRRRRHHHRQIFHRYIIHATTNI